MSSVSVHTLSNLKNIWPFTWGFMLIATEAAVITLDLLICFSLNKNYRLRFEFSMWSGSVKIIIPSSLFILLKSDFKILIISLRNMFTHLNF